MKILVEEKQLVIVKNAAPETGGGTWLHPKLAIHFARWLDPKVQALEELNRAGRNAFGGVQKYQGFSGYTTYSTAQSF